MPLSDEQKAELMKPFQEKIELVDGFMEEIREKLGADNATLVNDSLIGMRGTLTEAASAYEETAVANFETQERNKKLADVNNDLYIKNSAALKNKPTVADTEIDDDDALDTYVDELVKGR